MTIKIVAGEDTYNLIQHLKQNAIPKKDGNFDSESLSKFQEKVARNGFLGAQIVKSNYGYSVRYDSGLQNWGLLASSRAGTLDGSITAAIKFCEAWVAQSPSTRYAWVMDYEALGV